MSGNLLDHMMHISLTESTAKPHSVTKPMGHDTQSERDETLLTKSSSRANLTRWAKTIVFGGLIITVHKNMALPGRYTSTKNGRTIALAKLSES